jgi:predicted RNA-binding protein (virulence factor B family)
MIIGEKNKLKVLRFTPPGAYLEDEDGNEVLLPTKYIPSELNVDDSISVFVYKDSEDRIIATTLDPFILVNEFGYLKVKDVNRFGAFLDWGIEKDLMVPFREQIGKMDRGQFYLVYLYIDPKTERLVATQKIQSHFEKENIILEQGEEVDLLIGETSELGINVIINNKYRGLIYRNEVFDDLLIGDRVKGYVKNLRPDNKIDISLQKSGFENLEDGANKILKALDEQDGFLALTDKCAPEEIQSLLQMSKKNFKRSIGILYKKRLVKLTKEGIKKL